MILYNSHKKLFIRTLSSIALIFLALLFNFLGNYYFLISVALVYLILLKEYSNLFELKVFSINFILNYILVLVNFFLIYNKFSLLIIFPFLLSLFITSVLEKKRWLVGIFSYFYLAVPLYILIYLNNIFMNGKYIILWAFIIVWSVDISAFLFGNLLKGPKLAPNISPNKTWSGFLSSMAVAVLASLLYSNYFFTANLYYSIFLGFMVCIFCSLGDLFESWLKRINNKKDSSGLIPGHGGLLDRLDGFLFGIIIIYIMSLIRS